MAIEYNVSEDGLRIDTYPKGVLDIETTADYFNRLKNDERIKQGAIEVVYFKNVTDFKISYKEIENITRIYQNPKNARMIDKTVFVCESNLAYGIGRMLQTLHGITNPKHKVIVVRSESELLNIEEPV